MLCCLIFACAQQNGTFLIILLDYLLRTWLCFTLTTLLVSTRVTATLVGQYHLHFGVILGIYLVGN